MPKDSTVSSLVVLLMVACGWFAGCHRLAPSVGLMQREVEKPQITDHQLRVMVNEFVVYAARRIELRADEILAETNDVAIRKNALLLKINGIAACFQAGSPFTFWLVNSHTDPDEVAEEVDALADVFQAMRSDRSGEDDVILLGDLNANEKQLGRLGKIPGIKWVVQGETMTNTRQNKAYDNIIFDGPSTSEYLGRWGVFNLEKAYQLTPDQALQVSDHFPVWAEFGIWEAAGGSQIAGRGSEPAR